MHDRISILNALALRLGAQRYLEIGVCGGHSLRSVDVPFKVGVDPDPQSAATVKLTSDDYFARLPGEEQFDLIFIDGLHLREQVLKDVRNAERYLAPGGAIVLHDCLPPSLEAGSRLVCSGAWCGDVWRAWLELRSQITDRYMAVVDCDFGVGLILEAPPIAEKLPAELAEANWETFQIQKAGWLPLISCSDFDWMCAELPPLAL